MTITRHHARIAGAQLRNPVEGGRLIVDRVGPYEIDELMTGQYRIWYSGRQTLEPLQPSLEVARARCEDLVKSVPPSMLAYYEKKLARRKKNAR